MSDLSEKKCIPCEGGVEPLEQPEAARLAEQLKDWKLFESAHAIRREYTFANFKEALEFVNKVGKIAEVEQHHPDIHLVDYKTVWLELSTHAIGGLSENDFILAAKIDKLS